jgi:predicted phosphodiesterase
MTRLAVLADIHGNLPALTAVLADLARFPVDDVIVAGDVINWGPFSAAVLAVVAERGWVALRGNNEYYLLDHLTPRAPAAWSNRTQWAMLDWLRGQVSTAQHRAIAAWPDTLSLCYPDAPALRVVHGSPRGNNDPLYLNAPEAELAAALAGVEEHTVIAGHTHLPMDRQVGGWRVLNPGSVGVPLDGQHLGRYLLLEGSALGWQPTFRSVPIDPAPVLAELERQGFRAQTGLVGHFVMEEFRHARLELLPFLNWRKAHCPDAPFTEALLPAYAQVNPRDYLPAPYQAGWQLEGVP